jgi:hypothetical protein
VLWVGEQKTSLIPAKTYLSPLPTLLLITRLIIKGIATMSVVIWRRKKASLIPAKTYLSPCTSHPPLNNQIDYERDSHMRAVGWEQKISQLNIVTKQTLNERKWNDPNRSSNPNSISFHAG